jgi:RND family efflux transporter MFP subunit
MEEAIEVVGTLAAKSEVEVKSEYSSIVAEVFVKEWVRVKKGTPLARLDTREAEAAAQAAKASLLQAEVAGNRAQRELDRTIKLKESGLATQQSLDDARTVKEAADAAFAAARAQLQVVSTRIEKSLLVSPIDGVVSRRTVNAGDYVENMGSPQPMFRIVDNRMLELTVTVPAARISALKVGQPLLFSTEALPEHEFTGKISFINPASDEVSRTVKVRAEISNTEETLRSGLFVKGRIVTGTREAVVQIPRAALQSWDTAAKKGAVFVLEGGLAKRRAVETGSAPGEMVEVVKGLSLGDEVVVRGGFNLREGDKVKAVSTGV